VPRLDKELQSQDLTLLRISPTLAESAFAAVEASLLQLQQWLWWAQEPFDWDRYKSFIQEKSMAFDDDLEWRYFAFLPGETAVCGGGSISLNVDAERSRASVGYWVRTDLSGRGIATEIARVLTEAAFRSLEEISTVEISMDELNLASARVPEKLGFTCLGSSPKQIRALGHSGRGLIWSMQRR